MIKFERAKFEVPSLDKKRRRFILTAGGLRIYMTREEALRLGKRIGVLTARVIFPGVRMSQGSEGGRR